MPMTAERPEVAALRIGLRSVRANVVPMIVLWVLAAGTVWAYYAVPSVAAAFEPLREWQTESGWSAAFWTLMCLQIGLRTNCALVV